VVESHGPVTAANKGKGFLWSLYFWEKPLVFNYCRGIRIPVAYSSMSGSQMTI
jgi:hypothetical protein